MERFLPLCVCVSDHEMLVAGAEKCGLSQYLCALEGSCF